MMFKNLSWLYNSIICKSIIGRFYEDITDYEGIYKINRYGTVKSLKRIKPNGINKHIAEERILKSQLSKKGYYSTTLCKNGKCKSYRNSILVFKTFNPGVLLKPNEVIGHKNNIKNDDHIYNLQVLSNRINCCKSKVGFTSKYIGVSWDKSKNKWRSNIQISNIQILLGRFEKEVEAAKIYQLAIKNIDMYEDPSQFKKYLKTLELIT